MIRPDLKNLVKRAKPIVEAIGRESVDVYLFLADEFARGPITQNYVFQFAYRSFYRLDNAGLTNEFKSTYFALLENHRTSSEVDLSALAKELYGIPNRKGQPSLQFSFVTKLANTINPHYPVYDAEVANVFGFRTPYNYKAFDMRLNEYLAFHQELRQYYQELIARDLLREPCRLFREMYAPSSERVPIVKVLDFVFWSAGKLSKGTRG